MLPQTPERQRSIETLRRRADEIRGELYANLTPVAAGAGRAPLRPGPTRSTTSNACSPASTSCTAIAASPTTTPSSAASRVYKSQPVCVVGHQKGSDTKQKIFRNFGYARPGGLPQGAARDAAGAEVQPADHRLHRHARGLPGRRVGGARRRRGHRLQPARDDDARRADRRHRLRRRRQRRRARHRDRRSRADAGVLGLQRHPAGRVRGDPVARREPEGRSGGGAEDHRARSAARSG